MSKLIELNNFVKADNDVFHAPHNHEFAYTDGASTEQKLDEILRNAKDLSSDSAELQTHVHDWPSEYHLSSSRANLLRASHLGGVTRILELGCGCGSITRYLGEQAGVQVDAIEGSPTRAALAALRCRDQSNVTISTANFNDLEMPQNHYDLVLYVGVTEYAGRFAAGKSDQEALQALLQMAKNACNDRGVTLVAIENRLGLKYMLGAKEDHYAQAFVGIDDYPQSTGIRTYSKDQWQQQIKSAGFANVQFLYPFPDYKIPTLIVNDSMANAYVGMDKVGIDKAASNEEREFYKALGEFDSRDYNSDFSCQNEDKLWQSLHQAGTFSIHANSFLMLLSDSPESIEAMANFSYRTYPAPRFEYLDKASAFEKLSHSKTSSTPSQTDHSAVALADELVLLKGSRGWRFLNVLRRLMGKQPV